MTVAQKIIRNKLGILHMAETLGNVAEACRVLGYSRDSLHRFKGLYDIGGEQAASGSLALEANLKYRVEPAVEEAVVAMAIESPAKGKVRVSNDLKQRGIMICAASVRNIWIRHDLETFAKRLKALEAKSAQEGLVYTEAQLAALERRKDQNEAVGEIETEHPGYLGAQDTYFVGTIKSIGRIYSQTFIDTYAKFAIVKLYDRKNALVAADLLNDRVLPFFEEQGIPLLRMLTDRGTEYCGAREHHEYELYLAVEDIDHSKTRARRPQSNGICERFHKTLKNEFFDIAFRKKIYRTLEELQTDLDQWIHDYNHSRTHSGKYCYGKTPWQTFVDSKHLAQEKMIDNLVQQPTQLN